MIEEKLKFFELLKQKVELSFKERHAACKESIHDWKGKLIVQFQEDLSKEVGGYVSEKWFYTHLKTAKNEKLPRLDMLDMLARYVGMLSWESFVAQQQEQKTERVEEKEKELKGKAKKTAANLWMLVLALFLMIGMMVLLSFLNKENQYQFCIVDMDDGLPINYKKIEIFELKDRESPLPLKVDSLGCVTLPSSNQNVALKIQALYYQPITIHRQLKEKEQEETIKLKKDDYALMIHYFSTNKMEDWNKRRKQLDMMLSDNVRVVQINNKTGGGMALYNKEEFINKMTMPLKSLKNIEVLETKYDGEQQIVEIRFVQKNIQE